MQSEHRRARWVLEAVIALRGLPNDAEGVRARLERQQMLYDPAKRFRFLVTEAALRYLLCPPEVLRGQLDRLLAVAGLPNVELAILPFDVQLPYPALHGFWMYDDKVVLVDTNTAELALRDADDIALYERLFELLWERASSDLAAAAGLQPGERGMWDLRYGRAPRLRGTSASLCRLN